MHFEVDVMLECGFHDPTPTPLWNEALGVPALHGGRRNAELVCHRADAAELLENTLHETCSVDVRLPHLTPNKRVRQSHYHVRGDFRTYDAMDSEQIIAALKRLDVPDQEIADVIGRDRSAATKMLGGRRNVQARELQPLAALIEKYERRHGEVEDPAARSYLPVEVLPSYAGMGGGGNGEGDRATALISRALIEQDLRAQPSDLLVLEARGDSMEPDFMHGDQILIDKRDRNPVQPGPFALWDGDGYVVKLVERIPQRRGWYRVFSANGRYQAHEVEEESVSIMGRPVWFGRRL